MYVAFNYIEKGYRNKGLKIVFLSFFIGLLLGNIWTALNELTFRIYTKKIDTLKSEISNMKQEALNKELREDEMTKAQISYFEINGRYATNISELISGGFLSAVDTPPRKQGGFFFHNLTGYLQRSIRAV